MAQASRDLKLAQGESNEQLRLRVPGGSIFIFVLLWSTWIPTAFPPQSIVELLIETRDT